MFSIPRMLPQTQGLRQYGGYPWGSLVCFVHFNDVAGRVKAKSSYGISIARHQFMFHEGKDLIHVVHHWMVRAQQDCVQ